MSQPYTGQYKLTGFNTGYQWEGPAGVNYNMGQGIVGSYDGIVLRPRGDSSWRKFPNNSKLLTGKLFVPQGTPVPLHATNSMDPPEDSMFIFARNISSPACCPATFSTDRGCVCTTKWQRDFVGAFRGGNKSQNGDAEY